MSCKTVKHMVKETDAGFNIMNNQFHPDVSLSLISVSFVLRSTDSFSCHICSPPTVLRLQNGQQWSWHVQSAVLKLQTVQCLCESYAELLLNKYTILDFLTKSSTESAEKNFAVPFVGRTWFGPAK